MKILNFVFLIIILFSCDNKKYILAPHIKGKLYSKTTNSPIDGVEIYNDKTPIDSVAVYDFGDSLLTYTNSDGFFELKAKKKILKHNIYLKKKGYETDSLQYYEGFRDRLVPVKIEDLDTVVLKKSEK